MKTLLTFLLFLGTACMATAQDNWKLIHNGTSKLQAKGEAPEENIVSVRIADLNKTGALAIAYTAAEAQKGWVRTIMLVDDTDTELATFKGASYTIKNADLRSHFKKSNTIHVYTMALPSDPKQAALVRVRRVHLATLKLVK